MQSREILDEIGDRPVAVHHQGRSQAYLLSAAYFDQLITRIEDLEGAGLLRERAGGPFVELTLDEL